MSLSVLLNIGQSALNASQTQLAVTGHNIANTNTPGYCRQEVILEVSTLTGLAGGSRVGEGVSVAAVKRQYDALLQQQIYGSQQEYGKSYTLNRILAGVEQLFNEAQELGLAQPLADFFNAWQDVADNPEGLTERNLLLQKAETLTAATQRVERGLTETLESIEEGIVASVERINDLVSQIARINGQIMQAENGTATLSANNLRDQRDALLQELSNLVDVSYWEDQQNGSLQVTLGMRTLVDGWDSHMLSAVVGPEGQYHIYLSGQDITGRIGGGELGGQLAARQEIRETTLTGVRRFAAALANAVNLQHAQGYGLDGSTGNFFFSPLELTVSDRSAGADMTAIITDYGQLTLDEYTIGFHGGNYYVYSQTTGQLKASGAYDPFGTTIDLEGMRWVVSGNVSERDSFQVSPLTTAVANFRTALSSSREIAAAATANGVPGDNGNALLLAGLIGEDLATLGGYSLSAYYQQLVARVGLQSQEASENLSFAENFLNYLTDRRDALSGVSLDEEAADLIRFQQAYLAAARLIRTADELFETLINL